MLAALFNRRSIVLHNIYVIIYSYNYIVYYYKGAVYDDYLYPVMGTTFHDRRSISSIIF